MKILRVVTSGVSTKLIEGQLGFLSKNGLDVHFAAGSPREKLDKLEKIEGVRTHYLSHLVRPISLLKDWKALLEIVKLFRIELPDVVHANTPKGSLLAMIAAKWCKVPVRIYTVTGLRFEGASGATRWVLKTMERITCWAATKVIPEGVGVANTLQREKITKKELKVLHHGNINGVDLNYFNPELFDSDKEAALRAEMGIAPSDIVLCFVGRVVRDKGIVELVNSFKQLSTEFGSLKLLLVGSFERELDPLPNEIEQEIDSNPNIISTGWQNDVRPLMSISNLYVFPSYREGFPNTVLQAGAMGLPTIATDINGANEIITDGVNGVIIPPKDSDALYNAIRKLLDNPDILAAMAVRCRPNIVEKYNRDDVWLATLNMYKEEIQMVKAQN